MRLFIHPSPLVIGELIKPSYARFAMVFRLAP